MGYDAFGNFDGIIDTGTFADPSSFDTTVVNPKTTIKTLNPEDTPINRRNYQFSQSNQGKYNISNLRYPDNTSSVDDNQHYVAFYINVPESSKFSKGNRIGVVNNEGQNRTDAANSPVAEKFATAAAGLAGVAIGGALAYKVAKAIGFSNKRDIIKTAAIGALASGIAGAAIKEVQFKPEKTYRISDVIMLAIQTAPSVNYSTEWQTGELGQIGGMFAGGSSAADSTRTMGGVASEITRSLAMDLAKTTNIINSTHQIQNFLELTTQRVANPQKEQLFKSVGFRTFKFDYKFMPESLTESINVKNIIDTFKFHSHPELSDAGLFYIYPSTFSIQYYYRGDQNDWINKISDCALTNVAVTYGGNSEWSTFDNGAPVEINMSLTFSELEILTKERVLQGY